MKSIKNHFSLIIPLFIMFFSFNLLLVLDRTLISYEAELLKDYNVVIIASKEIDLSSIVKESKSIGLIKNIDVDKVLDSLNVNMNDINKTILKSSLPLFYRVKLKSFLNSDEIQELKKNLLKNPNILKVEEFKSSHDLIHRFLILVKTLLLIFSLFILTISLLLITKQISIWVYEHSERITIMDLFGAPFFMKSAILYKLMIIDSLLSVLGVIVAMWYIMNHISVTDFYQNLGVDIPLYNTPQDMGLMFLIAIVLSLLSVSLTIIRHKKDIYYT